MNTTDMDARRARLHAAIAELTGMGREPRVRIALAEAEFRLAITPGTEPAEAIERLRAAISHDPFIPKFYVHLGRLLQSAGRHHAALSEYHRAVRLAPSNRRAHLLLALALLELDEPEREIGRDLLAALFRGSPEDLRTAVADLDALLEKQRSGDATGKKDTGSGDEKRRRRPGSRADGNSRTNPDTAGWPDVWRVALVEQLSRTKRQHSEVTKHLEVGSARLSNDDGIDGIAEYAVACVLLIVAGDSPKDVRKIMNKAGVEPENDHPAVIMLEAVLDVAASDDQAVFVATATEHMERGLLPPELACWLHYDKWGRPSGTLTAAEALRLLDDYPERIRDYDCFRELRLALLDDYARRAWADGRFADAKLLWQETIPLDPYRVPVAVNLALLAARTKSVHDYGPAWERLSELLYLHAAGAADVQMFLEDRKTLHLALSQQGRQRHCAPTTAAHTKPSDDEIAAWVADTDALDVWLREWDLYYVNARLHFRSPTHVLGVTRDASPEMLVAARDALARHVDRVLSGQNWAGIGVFRDLVHIQIRTVFDRASDLAELTKDPYFEPEKSRADALADEALNRGLLVRQIIHVLIEQELARHIRLGCSLARRQFALPWVVLQPFCLSRGLIPDDVDLVALFEGDVVGLAARCDQPEPRSESEWSRRVADLDECVALVPRRLELRVLRCRALGEAGRRAEAYSAALDALGSEFPAPPDSADSVRGLRALLVRTIDNVGFMEIPESVREPRDVDSAERAVQTARDTLQRFPHSGTLRRFLAGLLVRLGGEARMREAVRLLTEGVESALDDEQRTLFESELASARGAASTDLVRQHVKTVAESAIAQVQKALDGFSRAPGRAAAQAARRVVRQARTDITNAMAMANQAGLTGEHRQLQGVLAQLDDVERKLGDG